METDKTQKLLNETALPIFFVPVSTISHLNETNLLLNKTNTPNIMRKFPLLAPKLNISNSASNIQTNYEKISSELIKVPSSSAQNSQVGRGAFPKISVQQREFLKHRIANRPSRHKLYTQNILHSYNYNHPLIQSKCETLQRKKLLDNLNQKLKGRPGPLELVTKRILQVDAELEEALSDGRLLFKPKNTSSSSSCNKIQLSENEEKTMSSNFQVETQRLINLDGTNCIPISLNSPTKSEVRSETDFNAAKNMDFVENGETIDSLSLFSKSENIHSPNIDQSKMTKTRRKRQFCQPSSFLSNFSNESLNTIYTDDNQISCTDKYPDTNNGSFNQNDSNYERMLKQQQIFLDWKNEISSNCNKTNNFDSSGSTDDKRENNRSNINKSHSNILSNPLAEASPYYIDDESAVNNEVANLLQRINSAASAKPAMKTNNATPIKCSQCTVDKNILQNLDNAPSLITMEFDNKVLQSKLIDLKVQDLKFECKKRQLAVSGSKVKILERLKPYEDSILANYELRSNCNSNCSINKKCSSNASQISSSTLDLSVIDAVASNKTSILTISTNQNNNNFKDNHGTVRDVINGYLQQQQTNQSSFALKSNDHSPMDLSTNAQNCLSFDQFKNARSNCDSLSSSTLQNKMNDSKNTYNCSCAQSQCNEQKKTNVLYNNKVFNDSLKNQHQLVSNIGSYNQEHITKEPIHLKQNNEMIINELNNPSNFQTQKSSVDLSFTKMDSSTNKQFTLNFTGNNTNQLITENKDLNVESNILTKSVSSFVTSLPETHLKTQNNDNTNSCYSPKKQFNKQTNLFNEVSKTCGCCNNETTQHISSQLSAPQSQQKSLNEYCNVTTNQVENNSSQTTNTLFLTNNPSELISGIRRRHSLASCLPNMCNQTTFAHQCASEFSNEKNSCCNEIFENVSNINSTCPIQIDPSDPNSIAMTLSNHEEMLRYQQKKIYELQRELAYSQQNLRHQQQMIWMAKKSQIHRDKEGRQQTHAEFWLNELNSTNFRNNIVQNVLQYKTQHQQLQMQVHEHSQLVLTEQKLQEQLHVDQAIEDIVRIIKQDYRASLLIVQLLRKYQLERTSCVQSSAVINHDKIQNSDINFNQNNDQETKQNLDKVDCHQNELYEKNWPCLSACCLQSFPTPQQQTKLQIKKLNDDNSFESHQYISNNKEDKNNQYSTRNENHSKESNNKETIVVTLDDGPEESIMPKNVSPALNKQLSTKNKVINSNSRSKDVSTPIREILAAAVAAEQAASAAGKNNIKTTKSKKKSTATSLLKKKTKRSINSVGEALTSNNNNNSSSLDMEEIFRTVLKETSKSNMNTKSSNNNNTTTSKSVSLSEEQRLNCEFIANIINKESLKLAEAANNNNSTSKKINNKQNQELVTSSSKTSISKPSKSLINNEFSSSNVEFKPHKSNLKLRNENIIKNNSVVYLSDNKNETNKNNTNLLYNGITNNNNNIVVNMQLTQSSNSITQPPLLHENVVSSALIDIDCFNKASSNEFTDSSFSMNRFVKSNATFDYTKNYAFDDLMDVLRDDQEKSLLGLNDSSLSLPDYTLGYTSDELVNFLADETCDDNDFHSIFHNSSVKSEIMNSIDSPLYDINSTADSNQSQNFNHHEQINHERTMDLNNISKKKILNDSQCHLENGFSSNCNNSQSHQQHSVNLADIHSNKKLNNSNYHSVKNHIHANNSIIFNDLMDIIPPTSVDGSGQQSRDGFSVSLCSSSEPALQETSLSDLAQDISELNSSCTNLFDKSNFSFGSDEINEQGMDWLNNIDSMFMQTDSLDSYFQNGHDMFLFNQQMNAYV